MNSIERINKISELIKKIDGLIIKESENPPNSMNVSYEIVCQQQECFREIHLALLELNNEILKFQLQKEEKEKWRWNWETNKMEPE